jgi:Holliday junction resolvasome RuvABC endonuclease subunit
MSQCNISIAAFDMATMLGYAVNKPRNSGVEKFDVPRGASPGARYFRFVKWLEDLLKQCSPDLVVYEQPHHRGGAATEIAVGFATHLQSVCHHRNIEHVAVHTQTLKSFATGSGNAGKEDMIKACITQLDVNPIDDNHADALWLLAYAEANYEKVPMVPYQKCSPSQRAKCKELQ